MSADPNTTRLSVTALLRLDLMDAIQKLKEGKMKPELAQAIAVLSAQVLASAKMDLDLAKFRATQPSAPTALPPASTNGNGNGGKVIDYEPTVGSETMVKSIRSNATTQAREMCRAWMDAGKPFTKDFEDEVAKNYGLSKEEVGAIRRELVAA